MVDILFRCHSYMNKAIFLLYLMIFGTVIQSCVQINGSGYSQLTNEEKEHVKKCHLSIDSITKDDNLYMVDTKRVLEYLKNKQRAIVYEYLPFCSGNSGMNPQYVRDICKEKQVDCIVISSTYDELFQIANSVDFPIFVIDIKHYNTDNYQIYSDMFYHTITNNDSENRKICSFHLFENGKYIHSFLSIEDMK